VLARAWREEEGWTSRGRGGVNEQSTEDFQRVKIPWVIP